MTIKLCLIKVSLMICLVLPIVGCQKYERWFKKNDNPVPGFYVARAHLNPSFTHVDLDDKNQGKAPWIEAYVELKDQFDDPLKALGQFRFELFRYRPAAADSRGPRFTDNGIQDIDLTQIEVNQQYWDTTTRNYRFKLTMPELPPNQKQFILQITFTDQTKTRFEDTITILKN